MLDWFELPETQNPQAAIAMLALCFVILPIIAIMVVVGAMDSLSPSVDTPGDSEFAAGLDIGL